jgi:hypothetical protein
MMNTINRLRSVFLLSMGMLLLGACGREYNVSEPPSEGMSRVQYRSLWGYIDEEGDEVIPCEYGFSTDFSGGYAGVKKPGPGERFHFIDKTGQRTGRDYDSICMVRNGWAVVIADPLYHIIKIGEDQLNDPLDTVVVAGQVWLATRGDSMSMIVYRSQRLETSDWYGLLFPQEKQQVVVAADSNCWCLLDIHGNKISDEYESAGSFEPGSINHYRQGKRWLRDGLVTVLTMGLSRIFDWFLARQPDTDDETILFSGNLLEVNKNGKWGYIDRNGQEVIPLIFDETEPVDSGLAVVCRNNKYGFYRDDGKEILAPVYDELRVSGSWLICGKGRYPRYGVLNRKGQEIIACEHESITRDKHVFIVQHDWDMWALFDSTGQALTPFSYERIYPFSDGLAVVEKNELYGYINDKGQEVIKPQFSFARDFGYDHLAWVTTTDDQHIWIDRRGKKVRNFP